jgi:O-antigen/teichoic acid export membrane protein
MSGGPGGGGRVGGSGAVLGFRLISLSGVQGVALVVGNLLQLGTIAAVAVYLGAADLGQYSLLLFGGGLISVLFSLAVKPGTIRRTFGGGDDDDEDDEDEESMVSASPKRSLGTGLLWAAFLGVAVTAVVVALRDPVAELLLGDTKHSDLILWAGVLGATGILFRTGSISLWFERRPGAFLVAEVGRPLATLALMIPLLAAGGKLEVAIMAAAAGSLLGALMSVVLLRGSFEPNLDLAEVRQIAAAGKRRVPIVASLWTVQNADVFLLSRFVDNTELGLYALASKLGLVVTFFPQGFRVAMRPLRKSPVFKAVRAQYGRSIADGQILGYFVLVCITSILMMVLLGQLLIDLAPPEFEDAAPLIPLAAAGLTMPALWRTMNAQTAWPSKSRAVFVACTLLAALTFVAVCLLLAPEIGIYAAPVAMLAAFLLPISYFFVRSQAGETPVVFPYAEVLKGAAVATVIGAGFHLLPDMPPAAEAGVVAALLALYAVLLLVLRVIPENHWPALKEMATSVVTGRADRVNPRRGLRRLDPEDRERLRVAVCQKLPADAFSEPAQVPQRTLREEGPIGPLEEGTVGRRLVWALRGAGRLGGSPVRRRADWDGDQLAEFLFADEPAAVRSATMRALLDQGADPGDLRALEDLVQHLERVPADAWEGAAAAESRVARRRRAAGRRGRDAVTRAARAISKRI